MCLCVYTHIRCVCVCLSTYRVCVRACTHMHVYVCMCMREVGEWKEKIFWSVVLDNVAKSITHFEKLAR